MNQQQVMSAGTDVPQNAAQGVPQGASPVGVTQGANPVDVTQAAPVPQGVPSANIAQSVPQGANPAGVVQSVPQSVPPANAPQGVPQGAKPVDVAQSVTQAVQPDYRAMYEAVRRENEILRHNAEIALHAPVQAVAGNAIIQPSDDFIRGFDSDTW